MLKDTIYAVKYGLLGASGMILIVWTASHLIVDSKAVVTREEPCLEWNPKECE